MKQGTRIIAVLLTAILLCGIVPMKANAAFADVAEDAYYRDAVYWAVARGITTGKTAADFAPNDVCTRAEAVTFLWRFDYSPHGETGAFSDVPSGAYYACAVNWAAAKGISTGKSAQRFDPGDACTRGQIVTLLWRYLGSPEASGTASFTDVSQRAYYAQAVNWAVEAGIVTGVTAKEFRPNRPCTRAQIVTMLCRAEPLAPVKQCIVVNPGHQLHANPEREPLGPGSSETKAKVSGGTYGKWSGLMEYQLNLLVSLQLRDELERRGYRVVMTRETNDVNISNIERTKIANDLQAAALLHIHANGSTDETKNGAMTLCMTKNSPYNAWLYPKSRALAEAVLNHLCAETGAKQNDIWETTTMVGINWSQVPVTLIEMGYMTNRQEDWKLASADYQKKIVRGIADAIDEFLGN